MKAEAYTEQAFNDLLDIVCDQRGLLVEYRLAFDEMKGRWQEALAAFEIQEGYSDYWRQLYNSTEHEYKLFRKQKGRP